MPKSSMYLAAPLKDFRIPIVSWLPNTSELREFQFTSRLTYAAPVKVKIYGSEWYSVHAYDVNNEHAGGFFLPLKYYELWRRLVYGALFQEKMYEAWIGRTKRLRKKKRLSPIEAEEIRLKKTAGVRFVQYLFYRRLVLVELKNLTLVDPQPVVHSLIEFGIRESRDWMSQTFEDAKKEGKLYFRLDPTAPVNKKAFEKGYHEGLDILFPPNDDDWWKGEFTHFDFDKVFNDIAKSVPITMADESFQEIKWIIKSTNRNRPSEWNESELNLFSEHFMKFLLQEGKDPRMECKDYLGWLCTQMNRSDLEEGISGELEQVFGEVDAEEVMNRFDVDKFIALFAPENSLPDKSGGGVLGQGGESSETHPDIEGPENSTAVEEGGDHTSDIAIEDELAKLSNAMNDYLYQSSYLLS